MLLARAHAQAHRGLEGVVDPPLQARERADHEDTRREAAPDAAKAELGQDLARSLVALGHFGHDRVGGVRDDGASHAGDVARGEGDAQMGALAVGLLGGREDVLQKSREGGI